MFFVREEMNMFRESIVVVIRIIVLLAISIKLFGRGGLVVEKIMIW